MNATTTAAFLIAGCCLAAIPLILPRSSTPRRRLARVAPQAAESAGGAQAAAHGAITDGGLRVEPGGRANTAGAAPAPGLRRRGLRRGGLRRSGLRRPVAALIGVAIGLFVGGWPGLACGIAAAAVGDRALRRLEPAQVRADRAACAGDLPLAADLLAAALRSGAPVGRAVAAVAAALGGPLGERLVRTARSLQLGAEPCEAWEHLAGVPGSARLTDAVVRSSASGGALAGALTRLADDLRADRAAAAEAAARRAGVLIVLPLGLCFLPAFVLAGLAPVIVAVLGGVL